MKISLNWLNDFIDLEKIEEKVNSKKELANVIADKLTGVGFEVEEIIDVARFLNHVVVGKIEKIEKHPEADRLFVCQVNIGGKNVQIITSATNVFEGALVPVSLDGAHLANGIDIKPSKMRGVLSEGMFCSGEELGITDSLYEGASINGILIFKDDFKPGTPVANALLLNDYVLDVAITANRPDCMSVVGIAREVSAIFNIPVKKQNLNFKTTNKKVEDIISVKDTDFELCPRYMAAAVSNIKIEKSPLWMRSRLFSVDIHAINNIVDITNYVLIEYGQPMHAFDYKYLDEKQIVIRRAKKGEKIAVLNGNTYELNENNLVIADNSKACVIAGVIGGTNSCISDETKDIIFESAVFERANIRKTSRSIGVRTDSCARYEKGVDLSSPESGLNRALNLIYTLNAGEIASGVIDEKNQKVENKQVVVSKNKIDSILGINVTEENIKNILTSLGIEVEFNSDEIKLTVPPYRFDIENANDVAEEIIRMYGYDIYNNINKNLFENLSITQGKQNEVLDLQRKFKNVLVSEGFNEILNYSLVPENAALKLLLKEEKESSPIKLANPISEELATLRTTMAHSLLNNISYNEKRNNKNFKIMEAGRVYLPKELPMVSQPEEKDIFAFASVSAKDDFFTFKGYIEKLIKDFDIKYTLNYSNRPYLHPGISADLLDEEGNVIISFGKIHPKVIENYEITDNVFYAEIDCNLLTQKPYKTFVVKKVSKFPIVERDLAVLADEEVKAEDILTIIKQSMGRIGYSCTLFDIYRGKNLEGKKSLAFNLKFNSDEKTLTDEEINKVMDKILRRLKDINVVLR
ncbi:MAG: phenylalanine--tRNA ligase subunit beta [Clostridia bacterium]|nr:phenylalanine--tRNA ligase subunit beta [Clostridia bacterium]